ncbi:hypothetical protein Godav_020845 [Gossypium davidsonii]|uniref:Uncharacterized protein n=2 Tax=Gossypium TaxID=3633 RepID=A0A7J8R4Z0_GOSDV|nr:hypothetical protein [Gossypium davidsonii]MBA0643682.1 hypothetical protein [Gossypium klotzschianum]
MWNNRHDCLPTREPIIIPELACNPKHMPWFRIDDKPYLYREEARCQHPIRAPTESSVVIPSMYGTQRSYAHSPFLMQTPPRSLFYQAGSSFQPPISK